MIYLRVNDRSEDSFSFKWLKPGTLYKVEEKRCMSAGWGSLKSGLGTYYGTPKFYFDEISPVEVLIECKKRGIKIEDIKEMK